MSEDFEDFKDRVGRERARRAQRDAAERRIPGERLQREIREAIVARPDGPPAPGQAAGPEHDRQSPAD